MTTTRLPFIGSGRLQEGGALAVRKQDFNAHVQGTGFRHDATQIDMNPVIPLVEGTTVQEALENLHNLIVSAGTGFLSIGSVDGYIQGDYNVGTTETPTLYDTFNAAFADTRLQNGGLILVLAGTYHLRTTVIVPAGISIMGEISGTTISGEMQDTPMFVVQKPNQNVELVSGISVDTGSNVDIVKFMNLILIDNLDGYALFGEPSMTTVPMIQAQISSNLVCENVSFIGKIHTGAVPRSKTQAAIGYTGSGTVGTILKIKDCYLDGLKIGLSFVPGNNVSDFLTVESCKARIYGTEDGASQSAALNSFIVMSHCNAVISKNYFVGAGTYVNTFVDIVSGSGTDTKIIMTGNHGAPATLSLGKIINDATGTVFTSVIEGNAWGTCIESQWYITVGGGTGSVSLGDFNGVGAINTIISIANSISSFEATVIVNPGTYSISGGGSDNTYANLSFIGNKHGKNYPIFLLMLTAGTLDSLGCYPIVLGNKLQSIQFVSSVSKHSIRAGFNPSSTSTQSSAHVMEILDCIFIDTSLYALDLSAPPWLDTNSVAARTSISVKDCYFFQTGAVSDTVSCILPLADQVNVENCFFTGNGYALSIGHNGYTFANASDVANITIMNSVFDLTDYTITTQNSFEKSYIYVDSGDVLTIKNCQVYTGSTPIDSSLTGSISQPFGKFIHLKANNINIDDSYFIGPTQTFVASATTYAMTTLFVEPENSAKIRNSKFMSGALLLQVGGTLLTNANARENLTIENCFFFSNSQTLIDFDLSLVNEENLSFAYIDIKGCNFVNGTVGLYVAQHTNSSDVTRGGMIQLYVGDATVSFTNNIVNADLSTVGSITQYGVLMVNAVDNPTIPGDNVNPIIVSGNSIYTVNRVTNANAASGAACLLLRSSSIRVQNNLLSMSNVAAISSNFVGCLILDNPDSTSNTYSSGIVTGNTFSRRNYYGATSNLVRGYIQLTAASSTTNGGLISNNVFDSTTYNASSTALIEDNTEAISNNINSSQWVVTQNKNQTGSQTVNWAAGTKGIASGADLNTAILYGGVVSSSSISADITTPDIITFNYNNTGSQDQFRWNICLSEILPPDVTITQIEFTYQASAIPATTKTITGTLVGDDGTDSDVNTIAGTAPVDNTITASLNYTTKSTDSAYFHIQANINHSSILTIAISEVIITYHW